MAPEHWLNWLHTDLRRGHAPSSRAASTLTPFNVLLLQISAMAQVRGMADADVIDRVMLVDQPTRKFVAAADVAALVLHLCGPHSDSITGAVLSIDGGITCR